MTGISPVGTVKAKIPQVAPAGGVAVKFWLDTERQGMDQSIGHSATSNVEPLNTSGRDTACSSFAMAGCAIKSTSAAKQRPRQRVVIVLEMLVLGRKCRVYM
jgi:hypothetical protein